MMTENLYIPGAWPNGQRWSITFQRQLRGCDLQITLEQDFHLTYTKDTVLAWAAVKMPGWRVDSGWRMD